MGIVIVFVSSSSIVDIMSTCVFKGGIVVLVIGRVGITKVKLSSSIGIDEASCVGGDGCDAIMAADASACVLVMAAGGGKIMVKLSSVFAARGLSGPLSLPLFAPVTGRGRCLTGLTRGLFVLELRPEVAVPFRLEAEESGRTLGPARFEDLTCLGGLGMGLRGGVSALSF